MRLEHVISGDDSVQQHVASEREKQALLAVSPMARKAIKLEVLPQIEESVFSADSAEDLCNETKRSIEAAFSYKNALYTRLVNYKGIEQSDEQFLADLLVVMDEWLRRTKAQLSDKEDKAKEDKATDETSEKQEVEVTVKIESEAEEQDKESDVQFHDSEEPEVQETPIPEVPAVQFHTVEERGLPRVHEVTVDPELVQFHHPGEVVIPADAWEAEEDPVVLFGLGEAEE